jgi:hypothetical protein
VHDRFRERLESSVSVIQETRNLACILLNEKHRTLCSHADQIKIAKRSKSKIIQAVLTKKKCTDFVFCHPTAFLAAYAVVGTDCCAHDTASQACFQNIVRRFVVTWSTLACCDYDPRSASRVL